MSKKKIGNKKKLINDKLNGWKENTVNKPKKKGKIRVYCDECISKSKKSR